MTGLERLDLRGNAVADLSALSGLEGLRVLDLSDNAISDISPLAGLTRLRRLDLSGNRVADIRPLSALHGLEEAVRPFEPTLLVAHNASFEAGFLPDLAAKRVPGDPRWACTLRLAQHVWPDAPSFGLQALRYWRGVMQGERTTTAHQAWFDAACSARLLVELCLAMTAAGETVTPRLLLDRSHHMPLLLRVPLGKHKGKRWSEVPEDYCRWLVDKAEAGTGEPFDPAVVETARAALRGVFAQPSDPEAPKDVRRNLRSVST